MNQERNRREKATWEPVAAFACFAGSILSLALGFVFTTNWILNEVRHPFLHAVGITLLIIGIPILILGGHCLDLMEKKNKRAHRGLPQGSGSTKTLHVVVGLVAFLSFLSGGPATINAQQTATAQSGIPSANSAIAPTSRDVSPDSNERERILLNRIDQLEKRLATLESHLTSSRDAGRSRSISSERGESAIDASPTTSVHAVETGRSTSEVRQDNSSDEEALGFLRDTTFNLTLDGYYAYNFNRPVGGINLLRAYDVQSNSFSLNQAALIIENAPNLEKGKRYGLRLDLQYGQATETVQGNAANEPRPQVYRNLWQAYGTYVFNVGKGLTVDFGKFASALGYETNYTKDNFNYTRAYFFTFLPFYHYGFRSTYSFNDKVTLTHWLVNGVQQSEDFNGFKSQAVLLTWKPTPRITSQFNYYNGQEQRDRNPALNPTFAPVASQPGLSTDVIRPVPSGRFHVLDTYHTFNVTDKLTLALEGDYVIGRVLRESPPATVWGGVGYARYQWTPKFALAGRFEYLSEKVSTAGGLFSGVSGSERTHGDSRVQVR